MKKEPPKHELKSLKDLLEFTREYPEFMDELAAAIPKSVNIYDVPSDRIQPVMPYVVRLKLWGMSNESIRLLINFGTFYWWQFDSHGFSQVMGRAIKIYAQKVRCKTSEEVGVIIDESWKYLNSTYRDELFRLVDAWYMEVFGRDRSEITIEQVGFAVLDSMQNFEPSLYFRRVTAQILGRKMVDRLKLLYGIDFDSNKTASDKETTLKAA